MFRSESSRARTALWLTRPASAFTLVELLVVVAIIALIVMLAMPALGNAWAKAKRVKCLNNLKQMHGAAINYATDHQMRLPVANPDNPCTFDLPVARDLDNWLKAAGISSNVFYCPTIIGDVGVAGGAARKSDRWLINNGFNECNIGYFYIATPELVQTTNKFTQGPYGGWTNVPVTVTMLNRGYLLGGDVCASLGRGSGQNGLEQKYWQEFPHDGPGRPRVSNVCFGDGSVEVRPREALLKRYEYNAASTLYW